jgi:hypothetical protein
MVKAAAPPFLLELRCGPIGLTEEKLETIFGLQVQYI